MVPHPAVLFLILIALVILLYHILQMVDAAVTFQTIHPATHELE